MYALVQGTKTFTENFGPGLKFCWNKTFMTVSTLAVCCIQKMLSDVKQYSLYNVTMCYNGYRQTPTYAQSS